uniref:Uncharacterized protein n=2 Tax=viral metagenome TaxID=1070528 RepID=A0A6H1ZKW2_9ZZZZ
MTKEKEIKKTDTGLNTVQKIVSPQFCPHCGGEHEPDPPDCWVNFKGKEYTPPFKCLCCGKEICMRQFAYGRCCGPCDIGMCQPRNKTYNPKYFHEKLSG